MLPRTRWNASQASQVLRALERSGLSVQEFARREGVDAKRLYRWRNQLETAAPEHEHPPRFVEVRTPTSASNTIEIVLRSGHLVRIAESADLSVVTRLVALLEQPQC